MITEWFIGNAAGSCKSREDVQRLARSAADVITVGSITIPKSGGNPGTNHHRNQAGTSSNALGLNNGGRSFYEDALHQMIEVAHAAGKKVSVSFAPKEPGDAEELLEFLSGHDIDCAEWNGGCPNIWKDGKPTRVHSYDLEAVDRDMRIFSEAFPDSGPVEKRYKDSYTPDVVLLGEKASIFRPYQVTLVEINTFANGLMFTRDGRYAIPFGKHLGGMSGPEYRPLALGQILLLKEMLPEHRFIGVMGIQTWSDVQEYLSLGIDEVQIGGEYYYTENPRIFSDIRQESVQEMPE